MFLKRWGALALSVLLIAGLLTIPVGAAAKTDKIKEAPMAVRANESITNSDGSSPVKIGQRGSSFVAIDSNTLYFYNCEMPRSVTGGNYQLAQGIHTSLENPYPKWPDTYVKTAYLVVPLCRWWTGDGDNVEDVYSYSAAPYADSNNYITGVEKGMAVSANITFTHPAHRTGSVGYTPKSYAQYRGVGSINLGFVSIDLRQKLYMQPSVLYNYTICGYDTDGSFTYRYYESPGDSCIYKDSISVILGTISSGLSVQSSSRDYEGIAPATEGKMLSGNAKTYPIDKERLIYGKQSFTLHRPDTTVPGPTDYWDRVPNFTSTVTTESKNETFPVSPTWSNGTVKAWDRIELRNCITASTVNQAYIGAVPVTINGGNYSGAPALQLASPTDLIQSIQGSFLSI